MTAEKKIRPSPTESATEHEVGTIMTGNDGNEYIVAADKNGKHRWAKNKVAKITAEEQPEQEPTKTRKPRAPKKAKEPETPEPAEEEPVKTEKKKSVRKAPAEHAKDYEEGYEMEGLDGRTHVVRVTKTGIKRWVACH